ncbi:MAG: transglycosylase SLT domain-containing protein, partial [Nanoarchaeota archaeon]
PNIKKNRRNIVSLERTIKKAEKEVPEVKYILAQYGVKEELASLPFTESLWEHYAVSEKKAVGLWQFMEETAQRYGLKIVKETIGYDAEGKKITEIRYDERLNPILSTIAAAKYLGDLERTLCNTDLAIKAFNGGSGKFKPFVDENSCENISLTDFLAFRGKKIEEWYSHIKIKEGYTLSEIMNQRGIPWKNRSKIMRLNGMKNPNELKIGQVLYIPFEFAEKFKAETPESILENVEYIAKHKAMMHVLKTQYPEFYAIKPSNGFAVHTIPEKQRGYTVKKGDYPWKIAEQYARGGHKDFVREIKLINGDGFSTGQRLQIPSSTTLAEFALYNGHNLKKLMELNPQVQEIYMQLPNGAKIVYPLQQERTQQI